MQGLRSSAEGFADIERVFFGFVYDECVGFCFVYGVFCFPEASGLAGKFIFCRDGLYCFFCFFVQYAFDDDLVPRQADAGCS